jgi:hypothetical protein
VTSDVCQACPLVLARDRHARAMTAAHLRNGLVGDRFFDSTRHRWTPEAYEEAGRLLREHMARDCPGAVPLCSRTTKAVLAPIRETAGVSRATGRKADKMDDGAPAEVVLPDGQRRCEHCGRGFYPKRPGDGGLQRFHSTNCRTAHHKAARREQEREAGE